MRISSQPLDFISSFNVQLLKSFSSVGKRAKPFQKAYTVLLHVHVASSLPENIYFLSVKEMFTMQQVLFYHFDNSEKDTDDLPIIRAALDRMDNWKTKLSFR